MIYTCKCCKYETKFKKDYIKHLTTQKHINNFKTNKYCDLCDKKYLSTKAFKIHWIKSHKDFQIEKVNNNLEDITYNDDKNNDKNNNTNKLRESTEITKYIRSAPVLKKYLNKYYDSIPHLIKLTQKNGLRSLREYYKCPLNETENIHELQEKIIDDYLNNSFIRNICKPILNIINYKNSEKQSIWNTDCSRYNFLVKTSKGWEEDKSGIKFTDFVIKPLLIYISELLYEYISYKPESKFKIKTRDEIEHYLLKLNISNKIRSEINKDNLIKPILKELSPYLRYLESELDEFKESDESDESKLDEFKESDELDESDKLKESDELDKSYELDKLEETDKSYESKQSTETHRFEKLSEIRKQLKKLNKKNTFESESDIELIEEKNIPLRVKYPPRKVPLKFIN